MTYDATERSAASAQPVELYKFTGNYNTYRMTSHVDTIINTEGTYTPEAIKRNKLVTDNQENTNASLELEVPYTHPLITEYVFSQSPPNLVLELFRAHLNDVNDTILLGRDICRAPAKIKVPTLFNYILDGPCPPIKYQAPCNHILGDVRCGVDMSLPENSHTTTVSAISGNVVTLNSNPFPDGGCNAGEMIFNSGAERRMITSSTLLDFTVATPFAGLAVSDTVTIQRGCNHAFNGHCKTKFNNGRNFGGFPLVPDKNPFAGRI